MEAVVKKRINRHFLFVDHVTGEAARATIPEVVDASYGKYVWPCAPVLAQYVWHNRNKTRAKHVLEIGAGTALPGVIAARTGSHVTLSDAAHLPECLENCWQTCKANNLVGDVKVVGVTWGQFDPGFLTLDPVDIVLGSDCFYDPKDFEDILVTVSFLMDRNDKCEFWTTYQERSSDRSLEFLLGKWGLHCARLPLASFDAASHTLGGSTLPGPHTIQMLVITKRRDM